MNGCMACSNFMRWKEYGEWIYDCKHKQVSNMITENSIELPIIYCIGYNLQLKENTMSEKTIKTHEKDYKPEIWKQYSLVELGVWVHLFVKRSTHRDNDAKKEKDLYDAQNYLDMMQMKLNELK